MRRIVLPVLLIFTGCTSSEPTYLANGMPAYRIDCSGAIDGLASCYARAAELCGARGFVLYDWTGKALPLMPVDPDVLASQAAWGGTRIMIACRIPPPPPPPIPPPPIPPAAVPLTGS